MATEFYCGDDVDVEVELSDQNGLPLVPPGSTVYFRMGQRVSTAAAYEATLTAAADGITWLHTIPNAETADFNGPYTVMVIVHESGGRKWTALKGSITFNGIILPKV